MGPKALEQEEEGEQTLPPPHFHHLSTGLAYSGPRGEFQFRETLVVLTIKLWTPLQLILKVI